MDGFDPSNLVDGSWRQSAGPLHPSAHLEACLVKGDWDVLHHNLVSPDVQRRGAPKVVHERLHHIVPPHVVRGGSGI